MPALGSVSRYITDRVTAQRCKPSLGYTVTDIYRNWMRVQREQDGPFVVIGRIVGAGCFFWRHGNLWRQIPRHKQHMATCRPATDTELNIIEWSIEHGALQIESVNRSGVTQSWSPPYRYVWHQATGKPLQEACHERI